jgi:hypothetical protein
VREPEPELGRVLDRDHPLRRRDRRGERRERGRLPRAGPAGDEEVAASADRRAQQRECRLVQRAQLDEVLAGQGVGREAAHREHRTVER